MVSASSAFWMDIMNQESSKQSKIRKAAKELDEAIEKQDTKSIESCFSDDCLIELLGVQLSGKNGLKKAITWMYRHLDNITLTPVVITVKGNVFFEEFVLQSKCTGNEVIKVRQAEVLVYDDDFKVKRLSLYFDRLEMAKAFGLNYFDRKIVNRLIKESLKGLL